MRRDIGLPADKIDHLLRDRIEEHSVDGEIAPLRVFFRRGKMHRAGMSSIEVSVIRTKGRYFELKTVFQHDDHAEMRADRVGVRENLLHDFRPRIRRDVEILWGQTADHVAHAAAGEIRDVAASAQSRRDFARDFFHGRGFHADHCSRFAVRSATRACYGDSCPPIW